MTCCSTSSGPRTAEPADVDEDAWRMVMTDLGEWLLAEGDIEVKGQWREVNSTS